MGFTITEDITVIKAILETDPYMNYLGYTSGNIYKYKQNEEEIDTTTKTVSIYTMTSPVVKEDSVSAYIIYGVKVVAPRTQITAVIEATQQIKELLHKTDIGNSHRLELYDAPMELESIKGVSTYMVSFSLLTPKGGGIKVPPTT